MNKIIFLFFIISFCHAQTAPSSKIIKIRADMWCPFNCDPKDKNPGFMVELSEQILKKHGYTLDYQILNWSRAIHEARIGKTDGIIGAGKEDAEDFFLPNEPQGLTQYSIFGLPKTTWKYVNEDSLKNVKLGVINSYTYDNGTNELLNNKHPSLEIVSSDEPLEQLIRFVQSERIIGFVESDFVLDYFIKTKHKIKLKKLGQIKPNSQELFLAISPKHPEGKKIAEILSEGTKALRANGGLKKILKKYGLKDWKN